MAAAPGIVTDAPALAVLPEPLVLFIDDELLLPPDVVSVCPDVPEDVELPLLSLELVPEPLLEDEPPEVTPVF